MQGKLAEIQNLVMEFSQADRLALITTLWDSITPDELSFADTPEALEETFRRDRDFDSETEPGVSHEEVMLEVRQVIHEARVSPRG